jgi:hypothetical protein
MVRHKGTGKVLAAASQMYAGEWERAVFCLGKRLHSFGGWVRDGRTGARKQSKRQRGD